MNRALVRLIVVLAGWAPGLTPLAGQTTPYVPYLDPAYGDLDVLVARGLVRDVLLGQRPHSRAAFTRFVEEANRRVTGGVPPLDRRSADALERLTERFASDDLDARLLRPRDANVEMSAASSPIRDLRSGADGSIDGDLAPLLQRNQGRELVDGLTWAAEGAADVDGGLVAGSVRSRMWFDIPRGPAGAGADVTLVEAYARTVIGPLGLDLGRNHVALGFGQDGGPLLSHNARGLDMVRLATDRPLRLPGPLRVLGLWEVSALVANMGHERDIPGSALTIFRLGGGPSRHVEFGFTYLNHQGGDGSPDASLRERLHDIFLFWSDGGVLSISDKVVGADLRVAVSPLRTELYVNVLTTDDRGRFSQPAGGLWEDAIWLAGARALGLGPDGGYDARVEWRHAGARAHTHHQFTSGLTLDRRVIGDALGPNATGVQLSVDRTAPSSIVSVTGAWERYSGDDFAWSLIPGGGPWDYDWYLVADNPDEIRKRLTIDWTGGLRPETLATSVRLGYEHVTRYAYGSGNRSNFIAQLRVGYTW